MKTTISLVAVMVISSSLMAEGANETNSAWEFDGQAVSYYQTSDNAGNADLGSDESTRVTLGGKVGLRNTDIAYGVGFGAEGIALYRNTDISDLTMMSGDGSNDNVTAALTQAYLTYGAGNTSLKIGRQELPKALSPFAFSEKWNVFSNTFEAGLIVNTDIKDTTLVGAYVSGANGYGDMSEFSDVNEDGVYMLTAANTSIENVSLIGSYYFAPEFNVAGDANIIFGDATYSNNGIVAGVQGGYIFGDAVDSVETTTFGAKIGMNKDNLNGFVSYSHVSDGALSIQNLGGTKTPLYTQMIANQGFISSDADTVVVKGGVKAFGAKFGAAYGYTMDNTDLEADYQELDLTYSRSMGENVELFAGYVYSSSEVEPDTLDNNMVRFWAKYNF